MLVNCEHCGKSFNKSPFNINRTKHNYCSHFCSSAKQPSQSKHQQVICLQCNTPFMKSRGAINTSPNHFCSRSCSATYHNTHKLYGIRRSKLEVWLEQKLIEQYPLLKFHFNRKDAIGSELDIYIPSLKLAFELNGIFHYEPIFGESKLGQIQENDFRKFKLCHDANINLCIIDVSQMKHFKEHRAKLYFSIITNIIDQNF